VSELAGADAPGRPRTRHPISDTNAPNEGKKRTNSGCGSMGFDLNSGGGLAAQEPRVVGQFANLNETPYRRLADKAAVFR